MRMPEPEPDEPQLDMAAWTVEKAAKWVASTLELPADSAQQLHEAFEENEVDGSKLIHKMISPKRGQMLLKGLGLTTDDERLTGATQCLLQAMESALNESITSSGGEQFGLFISYRVWCDKEFAESLYKHASRRQLRPGHENRLQVYLGLVDGQRFDENWNNGLSNSTVFSPLLSVNCLRGLVELSETDKEDFVLVEWIVAIELQKRQIVKALFPITIEMQEKGRRDSRKDGVPGLYSQDFFEQLRGGKIRGKLEGGKVVEGDDNDLVELPDVLSVKSTTKARSLLQMLDPKFELTEELTIKEVVMRLLSFQAHFENSQLDSLESAQLAQIACTHGNARAIARDHAAQVCAERIVRMIAATSDQGTQPWAAMEHEVNDKIVDVKKDSEPKLWARLADRVAKSLPDFELELVQRVQNKVLWGKYSDFKKQIAQQHGEDVVNERELFHYATPDVVQKVVMSKTVGFDPRLGGGEYGAGTYFAEHAIYPVAYGCGWLNGDTEQEMRAESTVALLLAKVALGRCKDFGARCRSERGDAAAAEAGVAPGLKDDWGDPVGRHGAAGFHRPPPFPEAGPDELYHSVTGTEGDLQWSRNRRLKESGRQFGKQYVSFETAQAYPELLLYLRRRPGRELQLEWETRLKVEELAEQQKGEQDDEMRAGTRVHIDVAGGEGTYEYVRMEKKLVSANTHWLNNSQLERCVGANNRLLEYSQPERSFQLKTGVLPWHVSALGTDHIVEMAGKFLETLDAAQVAVLLGVPTLPPATLELFMQVMGPAQVVEILRQTAANAKIQAAGCKRLMNLNDELERPKNLTLTSAERSAAVASAGGIEAVVRAMREHRGSLSVQEKGCGALWNLTLSSAEHSAAVVSAGGIGAVVRAMREHAWSARAQERGCSVLRILASNSAERSAAVASAGGIEAVVQAMGAHRGSERVQEWGCDVLRSLASNSTEHSAAVVSAGGIEAVVRAMREHGSERVHECARSLLVIGSDQALAVKCERRL